MGGDWRLFTVRAVHTAIYVMMASATVLLLFGGLTGVTGRWLWASLLLVLVEAAVFIGSGMKCPLTAVAIRYGATPDGDYDTFFPERCTRHTLRVFGPMMAVGVGLLLVRWVVGGR